MSEQHRNIPPCKCHKSFAYISPTHVGHCCFIPAAQTCHPDEVAAWATEYGKHHPKEPDE